MSGRVRLDRLYRDVNRTLTRIHAQADNPDNVFDWFNNRQTLSSAPADDRLSAGDTDNFRAQDGENLRFEPGVLF